MQNRSHPLMWFYSICPSLLQYLYEFRRVNHGPHVGAYKNVNFRKGDKAACLSIMQKNSVARKRKTSIARTSTTVVASHNNSVDCQRRDRADANNDIKYRGQRHSPLQQPQAPRPLMLQQGERPYNCNEALASAVRQS